ncbi:hypothetical protein KRP22_014737 [Phytophthora ramorum]|nr:hypothetical protein KRP22_14513 [Phytophthora ramorum]
MLTILNQLSSVLGSMPWTLATALVRVWADPQLRYKFLLLLFGGASGAVVLKVLHIAMRGLCKNPLEGVHLLGSLLLAFGKTVAQYVARGGHPVFPQWTLRFELFRIFIRVGMEMYGQRVLGDESYASIVREQSEWFGTFWGRKACRKAGKRYEPAVINGLEHIWLRSLTPRKPNAKRLVVLYAHGGGFAIMSPRLYIHFSNALCSFIEKELVRQLGPEAASKTGDLDSIHQHALRLAAKAKADGVTNWEFDLHETMPHVFPIFPAWFLPHADLAIEKMAQFIVRQLRPTLKTNGFNPAAVAA